MKEFSVEPLRLFRQTYVLLALTLVAAFTPERAHAQDCEDTGSGSCWLVIEPSQGNSELRMSYDSAIRLKEWMVSLGFLRTSAEITALDNIIGFGSFSPVTMSLDPSEGSSTNLDCRVFDSAGAHVGELVFAAWLDGETNCGDVKHMLALHLNHLFDSAALSGFPANSFEWGKTKSAALVEMMAIGVQQADFANEDTWGKFVTAAEKTNTQFGTVEMGTIEVFDLPASGGRLVDLTTLGTVGVISSESGDFLSEHIDGQEGMRKAMFSSGTPLLNGEEAVALWQNGQWAFVPYVGLTVASKGADPERLKVVADAVRTNNTQAFLRNSYLTFAELLPPTN